MDCVTRWLIVLTPLLLAGPDLCRAQAPELPPPTPVPQAGSRPTNTSPAAGTPSASAATEQSGGQAEQGSPSERPSKKSPLEKPAPPSGEVMDLKAPPPEPGDLRFPINLGTALRLADARPLIVATAQASAWMAEADLQKAKVLWVPTLNLGFDYTRHDGFGPDTLRGVNIPEGENINGYPSPGSFGKPLNQNVNYFYSGGALFLMEYLTNILFEPLAARQNVNAARWEIQAAKNDAMLMTAKTYFDVHKYRGQYTGILYTVERGRRLMEMVDTLSHDLVPAVEVDRVRSLVTDLEQEAVAARRNWRKASADLTRVLRLDPRAVVEPLEHDHLQITMIDPDRSLDDLIPIGLTNRPELAAHQALVQAALVRIRKEKLRPYLPVVEFNGLQSPYEQLQVGVLGIGSGGKMNNWMPRDDISPQLMWQLESLGIGNMARVKEQRAEQSREIAELFQVQDNVAAEITTAQARLQSAAARVTQAEREVRGALVNYNGTFEGLQQTQRFGNVLIQIFRPQEAVYALQLLKVALDHYFATVAEYNTAQFLMFHALGYPAKELAYFRKAGEVLPVETNRPAYLPPVGTGPPPPTR
jgi:outer membrane protein TolC